MIWSGILDLSLLQLVVITLIATHITCVAVTIYLHRYQAHRSLELHPAISHFFRLWLWMSTGMVTKEWAAVHRKHHATCETHEDPHSPQIYGLWRVLFGGVGLYHTEAQNKETLKTFGRGTPDDWIENNVYAPYHWLGVLIMLAIDVALFGLIPGALIFSVQMLWIPFWAAGVVNGIGHYFGYRNFATKDASTNISPWGIIIAGEELHNNHHAYASSARLSNKWYEFDIGWMYIRLFEILGLAKVNKVSPKVAFDFSKSAADLETLKAIVTNRLQVMAEYRGALSKAYSAELKRLQTLGTEAAEREIKLLKDARDWLFADSKDLGEEQRQSLLEVLSKFSVLATLYHMRDKLLSLWENASGTQEQLVQSLQDWCKNAEASGIRALEEFSVRLKAYAVSA